MSASAAGTSVRVVTSRWFQGRRPQQLAAAGGICLLSSALAVQQSAGDVQGFSRLESAAPAVVAAAGISRPNFGIHQAKNKDELKHHSTGASTPKARVPRVLHGGEESSAPPTSSSPSPLSLDRLDLMDLKKDEALQVLEHIHSGGRIDLDDLAKICQATTLLLKQEPTLIDKRGIDVVTVVGDLHGSLASLKKVLELVGDIEDDSDRCIVFDGDFVDRGDESVEVLLTLLLLKIAYPDRVVLLRGNHEDSMVAQVYGFADELLSKYTLSDDAEGQAALKKVWDPISEIFAALPMGVVTDTAFIVHGGLPSNDFRLDQLRQLTVQDRSQYHTLVHPKTPTEQMMGGLLWSDPHRRPGIHANHIPRQGSIVWTGYRQGFLDTRESQILDPRPRRGQVRLQGNGLWQRKECYHCLFGS